MAKGNLKFMRSGQGSRREFLIPYLGYLGLHLVLWPALVVRSLLRASNRGYKDILWSRLFGGSSPPNKGPWVVIIAGGIGEVRAALRVAEELAAHRPVQVAVLTQISSAIRADHPSITVGTAPFNNPLSALVFLRRWRPCALLVVEFWDNTHLKFWAERREVPTAVFNVPITESETSRVLRKNEVWRWRLVCMYSVQAPEHRDRLTRLGVEPGRIRVTGPLALAIGRGQDPGSVEARWREILRLSAEEPVVVCGSTWPEDEEVCLSAWEEYRLQYPSAVLVLAPRNLGRIDGPSSVLRERQIDYISRAEGFERLPPSRVVLLDSYNELRQVYSVATVAFVGGTFVPGKGGHTPVEALAWGVPMALGPGYEQQTTIVSLLLEKDIATIIQDAESLASMWIQTTSDSARRTRIKAESKEIEAEFAARSVSFFDDLVRVN